MNLFNLDDKARIRLLEVAIVGQFIGVLSFYAGAAYHIRQLEKSRDKRLKLAKLNNRVVQRFVELSDPEIVMKVKEEFEFDVVTIDLDL